MDIEDAVRKSINDGLGDDLPKRSEDAKIGLEVGNYFGNFLRIFSVKDWDRVTFG